MANIFLISDTHFGHEKMWSTFEPKRPFSSTEEMDETMVELWNKQVKPSDKVYHLGDVAIGRRSLEIVRRLNGHKRLVRGNHDDTYSTKLYLEIGFEEIYGVRVFDRLVLSHIPVHPDSLARWTLGNVHGHLHTNKLADPRHLNVSVEQISYVPIALEDAKRQLRAQQCLPPTT